MRISVIVADKTVVIDGRSVRGIDMSGLDNRLRAMQWYGAHGDEEWSHKPNVRIQSLAPYNAIIEQARDKLASLDEAMRPTRESAARAVIERIKAHKRRLQAEPYDGIRPSRALFEMQLQCRFLPPGDPIPTPAPYDGHWLDADGTPRPFLCGELVDLVGEIRERNARIWSVATQHVAAVEALLADETKDADTILSYDYSIGGW